MVSVKGTVKLGASQLLIDSLEHSAVRWVLAVQATCSKTHGHFLLGCSQGGTNASRKMGHRTMSRHAMSSRQKVLPVLMATGMDKSLSMCPGAALSTHTEQW